MKDVRYSIIYKFFLSQIKFGNYQFGDYLPPIRLVDQFYHASAPTVRNAYLMLQEEGYISLSPGRMTTVVIRISEEECRRNIQSYYAVRREEIRRLNDAVLYVLIPLLHEGCRRLEEGQLKYIRRAAEELKDIDFYFSFIAGQEMICALDNRMAVNLFHEIVGFYQFPHALNKKAVLQEATETCRQLSCQAAEACRKMDREELYRVYRRILDALGGIIDTILAAGSQENVLQEPQVFDWGVYRERPQLCYSLAATIITDIMIDHKYTRGGYLPHYAELAEMSSVSLSTVRRTVRLLEELGVVEVLHGVGTRVALEPFHQSGFQQGSVKKVAAVLLEVLQIVRVAFHDTEDQFFRIPDERRRSCIEQMKKQRLKESGFAPLLVCMDYLLRGSDNSSMAEIGDKLYEGLVLGLPLLEAAAAPADSRHMLTCSEHMIGSLETGNTSLFYAALNEGLRVAEETAGVVSAVAVGPGGPVSAAAVRPAR